MPSTFTISLWLGWCFVFLAAIAALYGLLIDRLLAIRTPSRRRCPACWYDMSHTLGLTCSECGAVARSERLLQHSRIHWRLAACSLILALPSSYFLVKADAIRLRGWPAVIPTTGIILAVPWLHPHYYYVEQAARSNTPRPQTVIHRIVEDFEGRFMEEEVWDWQKSLLVQVITKQPVETVLASSYSEYSDQSVDYPLYRELLDWCLAYTELSPDDLRRLDEMTYVLVDSPEAAPAGLSLYGQLNIRRWTNDRTVRCSVIDPDTGVVLGSELAEAPLTCGFGAGYKWNDSLICLTRSPVSNKPVEIRLRIEAWNDAFLPDPAPTPTYRREFTQIVHTRISGSPAQYRMREESPEVGAALERLTWYRLERPMLTVEDDANLMVHFDTELLQEELRRHDDLTLGCRIELLDGDEVAAVGSAWWRSDLSCPCERGVDLPDWWPRNPSGGVLLSLQDGFTLKSLSQSGLAIRFVGDPAVAFRDQIGNSYWVGSATVPVMWSPY